MIPSKKGKGKEKLIRVEGEGDGKAQELIVRHGATPKKKTSSTWSRYEEFAAEWSETLITRKR